MAAIGYVRVSTEDQAKQVQNLPTQEKKVREFCKQQGWSVLQLFADQGQSARTTERPAFQKMLQFCRKNKAKVSHVVVADLSRFARNVQDQANAMMELRNLGIEVISVDEPHINETAVGKFMRNMVGSMNQFYSDSLSERIKYRMEAGLKEGRFLHLAPIGYLNKDKNIIVDPDRGPLIRQAFELIATGNYATTDAVLKLVTGLGLRTRLGNAALTKQTWGRVLNNPFYAGWIVQNETRVRGKHEPLISDVTFQRVQDKINGKSRPHQRVNDDFPLRGVVLCGACGKNLTSGWVKGRKERYPRYWCWQKGCGKVKASREEVEGGFVALLKLMGPTAELLAQLPEIAAREWKERKARIAKDAEMLSKRRADQNNLNQKTIRAKIEGQISAEDFKAMKASIEAENQRIDEQIIALDSERSTLQDLMAQAKVQMIDLVKSWEIATTNQKQELVKALFPEGLLFGADNGYFEPGNRVLRDMQLRWLQRHLIENEPIENIGAGDGI